MTLCSPGYRVVCFSWTLIDCTLKVCAVFCILYFIEDVGGEGEERVEVRGQGGGESEHGTVSYLAEWRKSDLRVLQGALVLGTCLAGSWHRHTHQLVCGNRAKMPALVQVSVPGVSSSAQGCVSE